MNVNDLRKLLQNRGWMTIENIRLAASQVVTPKEVGLLLKSLTISGDLNVKSGIASGPRMYQLRRSV